MRYDGLDLTLHPQSTSYFSPPSNTLDPFLFTQETGEWKIRASVRSFLLDSITTELKRYFVYEPEKVNWIHAWVAGSGASFLWESDREPRDLDVLLGIDFVLFRFTNMKYSGLNNHEIARLVTDHFHEDVQPGQRNWKGYEVTYFVNPDGTDIRNIHPYAAYNLEDDQWTVMPSTAGPARRGDWDLQAERDIARTVKLMGTYGSAVAQVENASNEAHRINARTLLRNTLREASDMYEEIHGGRREAFSSVNGGGYQSWPNYRWQSAKASGVIPAIKSLHHFHTQTTEEIQAKTYGSTLPDADTLIMRAVMHGMGPTS